MVFYQSVHQGAAAIAAAVITASAPKDLQITNTSKCPEALPAPEEVLTVPSVGTICR